MAELSLPSQVDFSKSLPQLPDGVTSSLMSIQSSNGIQYSQGQVIQWDVPARQGLFIDGKTAFIRFSVSFTSGATAGVVKRKPIYSVFYRLDEFCGSVPLNSVSQYNQVANMYVDTNFSIADVYGQQGSWGLTQNVAFTDVDGVTLTANATQTLLVSAPLVCSWLSSCDKMIPTGLLGAPLRIQLTLDSIANIVTVPANVTNMVITQPELCFQAVDFGASVENMIAGIAPKLYLKSQGWANSSQSLASGTANFNTLVFNHRYESIENLFLLSSSSDTGKAVNTWGDSFNPLGLAGVNGTIQFTIGQSNYPMLPLNNSSGGLASIQQYCRQCVGAITDNRNTMALTNPNVNQFAGNNTPSTADAPAKFIVGIPLSRVNSGSPYKASSLMSGVSAQQSPINCLINIGSAFNSNMNFNLIAQYTNVLEIDVATRTVSVIC